MTPCGEYLLKKNWEDEFQHKSVEQCWALPNGIVRDMCEKYNPNHRVGVSGRKGRPPWTNSKTSNAVKNKAKAYQQYKATREESVYVKCKRPQTG